MGKVGDLWWGKGRAKGGKKGRVMGGKKGRVMVGKVKGWKRVG